MIAANIAAAAAKAEEKATEASGQAASAQVRANASARMYNRDILNSYSLEQLYQLGQTADVALGTMTWESSSTPNANNCFLLLGAWTVIAISYDGTLWRLGNNPYRWTQI